MYIHLISPTVGAQLLSNGCANRCDRIAIFDVSPERYAWKIGTRIITLDHIQFIEKQLKVFSPTSARVKHTLHMNEVKRAKGGALFVLETLLKTMKNGPWEDFSTYRPPVS